VIGVRLDIPGLHPRGRSGCVAWRGIIEQPSLIFEKIFFSHKMRNNKDEAGDNFSEELDESWPIGWLLS